MPHLSLVPYSPLEKLTAPSQYVSVNGLVCIDDLIDDCTILLENLQPRLEPLVSGRYGASTSQPMLDPITQITNWIHNNPTATELHLVAHGEPGVLHLGGVELGWRTIHHYTHQIRTWQSIQTIYIYGCNVAVGDAGSQFLETLHALTGATVYASSTPIGDKHLGGNWQLDTVYGNGSAVNSAALAFSETAQAIYGHIFETYKVTTLVDENDGGNGGQKLSLREAIALANAHPGEDKILFKASLKNGTIVLDKGQLEITDDLEIKGLGADKLTISGNNQSTIFAIPLSPEYNNTLKNTNVSINGLTLTEGGNKVNLSSSRFSRDAGAAIANDGNLTLQNSVVSGNTSGVIRFSPIYSYSDVLQVQIENSEISNNDQVAIESVSVSIKGSTISQNGFLIDSEGYFSAVNISNSTISDNGAGIYSSGYSGSISIEDSVITNNDGGIDSEGWYYGGGSFISIKSSIISDNGRGISSNTELLGGDVRIIDSQIINNNIGVFGRDVSVLRSTIADNDDNGVDSNSVIVYESVISGNNGIGVYVGDYRGSLELTNSTISGNTKDGVRVEKGSAYYNFTPATISNSTITNNGKDGGIGVVLYAEYPQFSSPIKISNSIVSGNYENADVEGPVESEGNNLIGNGDGATGLGNGVNSDQVGTATNPIDAKLGPLQDNGGPTQTHALLPGSLAIDSGNNAFVPVDVTTDQRGPGFDRIFNGVVDIGAFEVQSGVTTPLPGVDIVGTGRKDILQGTELGERIDGEKGNDRIDGNAGNDVIVGGIGQDDLIGGIGSDTFVYETFKDRNDTIRDFEAGIDTIDLSLLFIESKFSRFDDSAGRFDNYVRLRQRPQGVSVEGDQLGDNGTNFVRMAFLRDVELVDLSINDFQLS